jgi:hypothetical protein
MTQLSDLLFLAFDPDFEAEQAFVISLYQASQGVLWIGKWL